MIEKMEFGEPLESTVQATPMGCDITACETNCRCGWLNPWANSTSRASYYTILKR